MILDTNAVSAILAGETAIRPIISAAGSLFLPSIVVGEYRYGLSGSRWEEQLTEAFEKLTGTVVVVPVDEAVARQYAVVRRELRDAGTPIPENDVWIAACAMRHEVAILSRDAHFDVVRGIKRIGW